MGSGVINAYGIVHQSAGTALFSARAHQGSNNRETTSGEASLTLWRDYRAAVIAAGSDLRDNPSAVDATAIDAAGLAMWGSWYTDEIKNYGHSKVWALGVWNMIAG